MGLHRQHLDFLAHMAVQEALRSRGLTVKPSKFVWGAKTLIML